MKETKLTRDFPSNSDKSKSQKETPEKIQKVPEIPKCQPIAHGTKKSFFSKFLSDGIKDVGSVVLNDILIPAAKSTLYDIIIGGASMSLWGERRKGNDSIYRDGGRTYVRYDKHYNKGDDRREGREISRTARARHDFDDIGFNTRDEAEDVLSALVDQTIEYRAATVANFYELSGIDSTFTDCNYGWTDLRDAYTIRSRNKYIIVFPPPKSLD